jgi:hypothetical protein
MSFQNANQQPRSVWRSGQPPITTACKTCYRCGGGGHIFRDCPHKNISPIAITREIGDIVFLKENAQSLQQGSEGAAGHPVIILDRTDDYQHFIVTTVSAYSSGPHNNYLPPWQKLNHRNKQPNGFRAFEGSERPNRKCQHLRLADNMKWPKPETSWVYINSPLLVPGTDLDRYDRVGLLVQLHMDPNSLKNLLRDMSKYPEFRAKKTELAMKVAQVPRVRAPLKELTNAQPKTLSGNVPQGTTKSWASIAKNGSRANITGNTVVKVPAPKAQSTDRSTPIANPIVKEPPMWSIIATEPRPKPRPKPASLTSSHLFLGQSSTKSRKQLAMMR